MARATTDRTVGYLTTGWLVANALLPNALLPNALLPNALDAHRFTRHVARGLVVANAEEDGLAQATIGRAST